MLQKSNTVGIYCRLSQEDRNKVRSDDDSESIRNQKLMLTEYAMKQGWDIYSIYSDDDYTGTDHSRPEFNRLLKDAEDGKIGIVLCKSQSRFTRDMEDVEHYIHGLFPEWGVRFVSIVDNADTEVKGNKKSRQINAMVNEWYLEDMSDSIKAVLTNHRKNGMFIGAFAPYGYKKDPARKGHLIIDEPAASMVRRIFSLYIEGHGRRAIAEILNEDGIPSPALYKNQHGLEYKNQHYKSKPLWRYYAIGDILRNEVYIGNLIQNKAHSISYKTKKKKPTDKSEWIRVENTHEPIIDMKTWELVRMIAEERSTPGVSSGYVNIFSCKLKCGLCGGNLGRHKSRIVDYRCLVHSYDNTRCKGTRITYSLLYDTVLKAFRQHIADLADIDGIANNISIKDSTETRIKELKDEISAAEASRKQSIEAHNALLISKANGELSEDIYRLTSAPFIEEIERCSKQIERSRAELEKLSDKDRFVRTQADIAKEYLDCEELNNVIVKLFIDHIVVNPTEPYSRKANLQIFWRF